MTFFSFFFFLYGILGKRACTHIRVLRLIARTPYRFRVKKHAGGGKAANRHSCMSSAVKRYRSYVGIYANMCARASTVRDFFLSARRSSLSARSLIALTPSARAVFVSLFFFFFTTLRRASFTGSRNFWCANFQLRS